MSWQVIHLSDVMATPWRNGGGLTRELLAWPNAVDWLWRLSVAEVGQSGPFSRFDGVQRWFAVLDGAGVRLSLGGQTHELTGVSAPFCFDGAAAVDCELIAGATQDFNLMVRAEHLGAQMRRLGGEESITLLAPKIVAIYAIHTGASVHFDHENLVLAAHSLAWRQLPAGARVRIESSDALWMEIPV